MPAEKDMWAVQLQSLQQRLSAAAAHQLDRAKDFNFPNVTKTTCVFNNDLIVKQLPVNNSRKNNFSFRWMFSHYKLTLLFVCWHQLESHKHDYSELLPIAPGTGVNKITDGPFSCFLINAVSITYASLKVSKVQHIKTGFTIMCKWDRYVERIKKDGAFCTSFL